jgi:hypothetical protein
LSRTPQEIIKSDLISQALNGVRDNKRIIFSPFSPRMS